MARFKVYDLTASNSYLALEVTTKDGSHKVSVLLRATGDLYLPETGLPDESISAFYLPLYHSLYSQNALGFLSRLPSLGDDVLPELFSYSISPISEKSRIYVEPQGGQYVMKYHVVRISLETLVASFLLVDEVMPGDGVILQVAVPQAACIDHFGKAAV